MTKNLKQLPIQLFFFVHTISMAAMELLGWPLLIFGLSQFRIQSIPQNFRKTIWILLGLCGLWALSQLVHFQGADQKRLLGSMAWILLLWGLFGLFMKIGYQTGLKNIPILLWTLPVSAFYSVYQMFFGQDLIRKKVIEFIIGDYYRAIGFFNMPLTFAYVLGLWGTFALGQAAAEKKFTLVNMIAIFSGAICVLTSFTRGAWVALAVVLFLSFWFFSRRQKIFALIAASILVIGFIQNTSLLNRVTSIKDVTTDQSNSQRLVLWEAHFEIFKDNPIFGVGYGQTEKLLPEYYEKINHPEVKFYSYAHNIYVQALASGGLIGATALFALYVYFFVIAILLYRRKNLPSQVRGLGLGAAFSQLYFYIGGLTENNFYDGEVMHSLILLWAILLATYISTNDQSHHESSLA